MLEVFRLLAAPVLLVEVFGCAAHRVDIQDLPAGATLNVILDANTRVVRPGQKVKFYVDLTNDTSHTVDLSKVDVEIVASPRGSEDKVALRKSWSYRWTESVLLRPGRKVTLPIVPESSELEVPQAILTFGARDSWRTAVISEFPLAQLAAGDYSLRALVNGRFASPSYPLRVERPDLSAPRRLPGGTERSPR